MHRPSLSLSLALVLLATMPTAAAAQEAEVAVDLELVLAVDISGSVDEVEAAQQWQGYVAALADPAWSGPTAPPSPARSR